MYLLLVLGASILFGMYITYAFMRGDVSRLNTEKERSERILAENRKLQDLLHHTSGAVRVEMAARHEVEAKLKSKDK